MKILVNGHSVLVAAPDDGPAPRTVSYDRIVELACRNPKNNPVVSYSSETMQGTCKRFELVQIEDGMIFTVTDVQAKEHKVT